MLGTLYPDKQQTIDLIQSKDKVWTAFQFDGVHIVRVALESTDKTRVQRLAKGTILLTMVLFDKNDDEAMSETKRINLHEFERNDMTQAFLDVDRVIPRPAMSEYQKRNAQYWTVEFALEGVEVLPDESLTLIVTSIAK